MVTSLTPTAAGSGSRGQLAWMLLAAIGAMVLLGLRIRFSVVMMAGARPGNLYDGTAPLPFQYRDLVPLLARGLTWATGWAGGEDHLQWFLLCDVLSAWGSLVAGLALLRRIGAHPAWIAVLYVMMLSSYVFSPFPNWLMPYDLPALFFATLGLVRLLDRSWAAFYLLFPAALLNRETAVFLSVVFALVFWRRMRMHRYCLHLGLQIAMVVLVKGLLWLAFRQNPGGALSIYDEYSRSFRIVQNLRFLLQPRAWSAFGFMWVPFLIALPRLKHPFIGRALWAVPPFMAGMLLVANYFEFRIFSEVLPLMMAAIAKGLGRASASGAAQSSAS